MIFQSRKSLKKDGFLGFERIGDLFNNHPNIPQERGIYLVLYESKRHPEFLSKTKFPERLPNVKKSKLLVNWVNNVIVIYIGQAGGKKAGIWSNQTLKGRISLYMRFGKGRNVAHRGGRYIWQIENHEDLIVCWKPLPNKIKDPRQVEKEMICDFKKKNNNKRPFANRQN